MKPGFKQWLVALTFAVLAALVGALATDDDGHLQLVSDPVALRALLEVNRATR